MELVVLAIFTSVLFFWFSKSVRYTRRTSREPKHKQYDEDRYADYFMKKVSEVYNIKVKPEEPSEDDEEEEEMESNIEFEENDNLSPTWPNQRPQYNTYEIEEMETQTRSFDNLSQILEIIGILWLLGIIVAEANFPDMGPFLKDKTLFSLIIKTLPALFFIVAIVARILGSRNKSSGDRALIIFRGVFLLLVGLGYVINQVSDFLSNVK